MHADIENLIEHFQARRDFKVEGYLEEKLVAINDFFRAEGLDAAVIGISGGIDSAVALYLLDAASKQAESPIRRIMALSLPVYEVAGVSDQKAAGRKAWAVIEPLVETSPPREVLTWREINLGPAYGQIVDSCEVLPVGDQAWAEGQMASVLRTPFFYYYAAILQTQGYRSLVVGTTNRDEGAYIGFFGKASDGMVDLQLIADLHKSELIQLAELLEVPEEIIEATPKGDVWDGRVDEEMIGAPYPIVELYTQLLEMGMDQFTTQTTPQEVSRHLEADEEAAVQLALWFRAIERIHETNAHKYRVGSPARFIDVMPRTVPGGWQ